MQMMVDMMIDQAKMADEMFEKTGIEEDDFMSALVHHKVMNDPDIIKMQMDAMKKMGMGGMMAQGMGGMW